MSEKLIKVINAAFFYIIWWGCILGIKYSYNYLGPLLTIIAGIIHLNIISEARKESKVILSCGVLALFVESLHLHSGFLSYEGYVLSGSLFPPLWIICIWVALSITLNYSMFFLKDRWWLMVICGGIFGPWCYFASEKLNILHFSYSPVVSLLILSAVWALSLPMMYFINKRIYKS